MSSTIQLGLADHGHLVSDRRLQSAEYEPGYPYEIIEGRLYVSPAAQVPENRLENWLYRKLWNYADRHNEVIICVSNKSRVFVPSTKRTTVPEPALAAYADYPLAAPFNRVDWQRISPVLRNVKLFLRVPSIREYWILDARINPDEPSLIVRRRRGKRWTVREYSYRETYTTKLLPEFKLRIDPRR